MKSPFPGMDPYLESHWGDVHASMAIYARDQLRAQMPPDLKVRVEEYIAVEDAEPLNDTRHYVPDVRVHERAPQSATLSESISATAVADEPWIVSRYIEPPTQREIRISDAKEGGRLVTVIEILSPTNKTSGRADYRRKQEELLEGGVNLVEIDLQRGGAWVIAALKELTREEYQGPYRICVVRASDSHQAEMYRASYATRLPKVRIPLRPSDADAVLDVQALVDLAYSNGGYEDTNYRHEPDPPLLPEEQAWADKLLREAGRR